MYLLTYDWQYPVDSLSGPGWHWDRKLELFESAKDIQEHLDGLYREIGEARHRWTHKSPQWRDKTFISPYRRIKLYTLAEATMNPFLTGAGQAHDEAMDLQEAARKSRLTEHEEQERAELVRLRSKFSEVA